MKPFKILITGADGLIGTAAQSYFSEYDIIALSHRQLNINNETQVFNALGEYLPNIVFHCAALTNYKYEKQCYNINLVGALNVINACRQIDAEIVYFTYGAPLYKMRKIPDRVKYYDHNKIISKCNCIVKSCSLACTPSLLKSKILSERLIEESEMSYYIIRTGIVYGGNVKTERFVKSIVQEAEKNDEIYVLDNCLIQPIFVKDLFKVLKNLLRDRMWGSYNITNGTVVNHRDIVEMTLKYLKIKKQLVDIPLDKSYRVRGILKNDFISKQGWTPPFWEIKYKKYLSTIKKNGFLEQWRKEVLISNK